MEDPAQFEYRYARALNLRRALCALAFLSALALPACRKEKPPPPRAPEVEVLRVIQKDVPIVHEWVGTADGLVNAIIRAQVTGYLVRQDYREGDSVKKGQLLFEIDPRPFQAALDKAKGELARQEAQNLERRLNQRDENLEKRLELLEKKERGDD